MSDWREELRGRGFMIDDEPTPVPSVPHGRNPDLATWTVAWKRDPNPNGGFDETIRLPDGYVWDPSRRNGVHADRQYMTRAVKKPLRRDRNTIFVGDNEYYMNPWFFKWIIEVDD